MNLLMAGERSVRKRKDFSPGHRFGPVGIGVMVGFHIAIGYALISGLGKQSFEIVKKPMTATIIEEVKLPPPPPPPPKQSVKQEVPKVQAPPPPAYVPPPDIAPPATAPATATTAVQSTEPVAPPPAAPPAPVLPAAPVSSDIAVACPKQVKPEAPRKAIDDGISGSVKAEAHIKGGKIIDVRILSGPRVFHAAVRAAMQRYECQASGDAEVIAFQEFTFKVE